jgi:hypothetical protein
LLLSIAVIAVFGVAVFATGFVAKKLDIFDANYGKALWAALLKNGIFWGAAYLLSRYIPMAPRELVLVLAQATLIWISVLLVELVVGFTLVYIALAVGANLDQRFDLAIVSGAPVATLANPRVARSSSSRSLLRNPIPTTYRRVLFNVH